jgi:hypothetical protein
MASAFARTTILSQPTTHLRKIREALISVLSIHAGQKRRALSAEPDDKKILKSHFLMLLPPLRGADAVLRAAQ